MGSRRPGTGPTFEFRFPLYGSVRHEDITLELRAGLEPWHVLGEEGASGGTARYVDSSVERLQVAVSGTLGDRYDVSCNGWSLPLTATDRADLQVAGVRFRAWQPASCLHPTIGVDSPLIFDLVDRWAGRSVAGCAYHVVHPGGRSFETMPVNALEAEGRRLARFDSTSTHAGTAANHGAAGQSGKAADAGPAPTRLSTTTAGVGEPPIARSAFRQRCPDDNLPIHDPRRNE